MKNVYVLQIGAKDASDFIPVLWPSAKTYYEKYGRRVGEYHWVNPSLEFLPELNQIKDVIRLNPPAIFAVSMYVWNVERVLPLCAWVKENWPDCLVVTGGPHQYFKHQNDWFQKFPFIDASVPSEVYGELPICDILDNLKSDNTVDWNLVEQAVYPSRNRAMVLRSPKSTPKRSFDWDYPVFSSQQEELTTYIKDHQRYKNHKPFIKLETTRGCPYSCTFCDWGGGVGSKVILKSLEHIKQDLNFMSELPVGGIYMCDANFGINGQRDIDIIKHIAYLKKQSGGENFTTVYYGGYAKTNKHIDVIKEILTVEGQNNLTDYYKISQQSFHPHILQNVKRTDLRYDEHLGLATYMAERFDYEAHLELILGLPGITLDLWFHEFNTPWAHDITVRAYEWFLLPESESYNQSYRDQHGIKTSYKILSKDRWTIPVEIVTEGQTFTKQDYQDMFRVYMWYLLFAQGGIYKNSINNILNKQSIPFGVFLKQFYSQAVPILRQAQPELFDYIDQWLTKFTDDDMITEFSTYVSWPDTNTPIPLRSYFLMLYYLHFKELSPLLENWLQSQGADSNIVNQDSAMVICDHRIGQKVRTGLKQISYKKYEITQGFVDCLETSHVSGEKNIMLAKKRWLFQT
jgi:putative methyltransferase